MENTIFLFAFFCYQIVTLIRKKIVYAHYYWAALVLQDYFQFSAVVPFGRTRPFAPNSRKKILRYSNIRSQNNKIIGLVPSADPARVFFLTRHSSFVMLIN